MIDEILGQLFAEAAFGRLGRSRRARLLFRLFFGILGALLAAVGAVQFGFKSGLTQNTALRSSLVAVFVFLACFSLFNVGLGRAWRWPGKLLIISFVLLFASRLLLGP